MIVSGEIEKFQEFSEQINEAIERGKRGKERERKEEMLQTTTSENHPASVCNFPRENRVRQPVLQC